MEGNVNEGGGSAESTQDSPFAISKAWAEAKARATEDGIPFEHLTLTLLKGYVDGRFSIPPTTQPTGPGHTEDG